MGNNFTGPVEWKQNLGIDIEGEIPPIPWGRETLLKLCPFESGKTIAETHALFLLPKEYTETQNINGTDQRIKKQLTVWEWRSLIKQAKGAHIGVKVYGDEDIWYKNEEFAKATVDDMQWCLMPKNMLPNSTSKNYAEQENNPQYGLNNYPDYFTPSALQEMSKQFLHYLHTGEMLNSKYAWCSDTTSDGRRVGVGDFDSGGLIVDGDPPGRSNGGLGRAVARKF
ncbi:hypothetical protein HN784_02975 [bacterium]|jgi:hypothetical protein|nr:hypothetical protein [bacterium]MBT7038192.1 hypothetical protein [bacterium]MBT7431777.1 hypothetical protein [bacterium]